MPKNSSIYPVAKITLIKEQDINTELYLWIIEKLKQFKQVHFLRSTQLILVHNASA